MTFPLVRENYNPLDLFENLAGDNDWEFARTDNEISLLIDGHWSGYEIHLNWRDDIESILLACSFDIKVPEFRHEEVIKLTSLINEQLWSGHFDLWRNSGTLIFRNSILLALDTEASPMQCQRLLRIGLETCERYFPAFQFVIWAGKDAEQALESALIETIGRA